MAFGRNNKEELEMHLVKWEWATVRLKRFKTKKKKNKGKAYNSMLCTHQEICLRKYYVL
jgi:hypothetical protein